MKKIILIVLVAFSFSACEKDDICSATTTTTPKMVIDFYNFNNPSVKKSFSSLKIIADGTTKSINFSNTNQVRIPLKLDQETTRYKFIINGVDLIVTDDETDIVILNYTSTSTFVSRACGFKKTFALNATNGVVREDSVTPAVNYWINNIEIINTNITNENEIHVKIFF